MKQNKYLTGIERGLRCSKDKKKEICLDIRSDIEAAIQAGEGWEEIEARMGKPWEIAAEFNENMTQEELSKVQKQKVLRVVIIAAILIVIAIIGIFVKRLSAPEVNELGHSGMYTKEAVDQRVETIITLIGEERFQELLTDYCTDIVAAGITEDKLIEIKNQINPDWGNYQKITSSYYCEVNTRGELWAIVDVVALYDNCSITYRLSFTPDMELGGIYMK